MSHSRTDSQATQGPGPGKRQLIIAKGWVQTAIIVFVFGFFVLGLLAYRTYQDEPPIPQQVIDPSGKILFTGEDIGFDAVDAGPLQNARWLETLGYFNIQIAYTLKMGTKIGFKLVQ